jgi:hypothetical protein|uniref:Uncharacterized protein n=1 Tax=Zea mays TaxID=4577 RepID=C4J7G1_MAIZE|nr:unknown [Zea mays]
MIISPAGSVSLVTNSNFLLLYYYIIASYVKYGAFSLS